MSSLGDIQKQLSRLMSVVSAQGYKLEDVLPEEMQDHFHDMTALKEARAYIKEVEGREKQLQAENDKLASDLRAKQAEIDDQPEEFKALKIDLQQCQRSIDYYKELADNATERAERYQRRLAESSKTQITADEDSRKIQRLECELADHKAAMFKLLEENRANAELYETQHEHNLKLIEEKEDKIIALTNYANQLDAEHTETTEISEQVSEACDTLIQSLQEESLDAAELVTKHSLSILMSEQLYSAISSELAPINDFYSKAFDILTVYQTIFQSLSESDCGTVPTMPQDLEATLDACCEDLEHFQVYSATFSTESLAQAKVRQQVDDMAKSAGRIYTTLDTIKKDVTSFVNRLRNDPYAWEAMKGHSSSSRGPASPASSIRSFKSMAQRFSMYSR